MGVNVRNVLIRSEYGTAKRCSMVFMDRFKPKGERTEFASSTSLTQSCSLHVSKPQNLLNFNLIQPSPTISNRTIAAPRVFQRPLHRLHIDTHGFLLGHRCSGPPKVLQSARLSRAINYTVHLFCGSCVCVYILCIYWIYIYIICILSYYIMSLHHYSLFILPLYLPTPP